MFSSVEVAEGKAHLGMLTVLTFLLRLPDWQMNSHYTRGFRVSGFVEPSNTYPMVNCKGDTSLHELLEETGADAWNTRLSNDNKPFDHEKDVWDTAEDQLTRHLLSGGSYKGGSRQNLR